MQGAHRVGVAQEFVGPGNITNQIGRHAEGPCRRRLRLDRQEGRVLFSCACNAQSSADRPAANDIGQEARNPMPDRHSADAVQYAFR
jgi:hypothetical protein